VTAVVDLTEHEQQFAYFVACQRLAQNVTKRRVNKHGRAIDSLDDHARGCISEMALAKRLDRFWSGAVGNLKAKDVGELQARGTYYQNGGLIVHPAPDDSPDDRYFLVTIQHLRCCIVGWQWGRVAMDPKYWDDGVSPGSKMRNRPAFLVPQDALEPFV